MNWKQIQNTSEDILASGINVLQKSTVKNVLELPKLDYGNYLISKDRIKYIGEAKDVSKRLKQHSKPNTSTFYKNYKKLTQSNLAIPPNLKIEDFQARQMPTIIGRKEIEEFGIVNIPTNLNRFQIGKRIKYAGKVNSGLWKEVQEESVDLLNQGEKTFLKNSLKNWFEINVPKSPGLYWVEHPKYSLIYIGESSNIFERWQVHSGKTYFSALRRHIGENILDFELKTQKGKKRFFTDKEDFKVTDFLKKATIRVMPVNFGRYELEEYVIRTHKPLLNRKENK